MSSLHQQSNLPPRQQELLDFIQQRLIDAETQDKDPLEPQIELAIQRHPVTFREMNLNE